MGMRGFVLAGCCLLGCSVPAWAETIPPPDSRAELTSPRRIPGQTLNPARFPGHATVLTADDLRSSGAQTVQEALQRVEGVTVTDQQGFGLGSDSTVNVRGLVNSSRSNVLVLVDGVRQNRLTGDEVHWQSIPISQIERIEIIRGAGGLTYGEGALAGVIHIFTTQEGQRPLEVVEGAEAGSFGWQQYHLSTRGRSAPLTYGVNYTRRLTQGYRESSWSRNTTLTGHTGVTLVPGVHAALHVHHSEDTTAFPGGLTLAQTEARRVQTNAFHGFNINETDQLSCELIGGPRDGLTNALTLFWRRRVQTSQDAIDFNSFTTTPSRGLSLRTNAEWTGAGLQNLLVTGLELSEDKATTGDRDSFAGPDSESNRRGYGVFFEDTLTVSGRTSVTAGARFDKARYEEALTYPDFIGTLRFEGWSPKLAVIHSVIPQRLDVFASFARPFKAPNVDDFSARTPAFPGNADLTPQQATMYELGAKLSKGRWQASATGFAARIDDEILVDGLTSQNQNFDTRRLGVELSLRRRPGGSRLRTHATYTFVDAEFVRGAFSERTIPGTPEHTLSAGLGVSPLDALWIDLHWLLVQDAFRINDMTNALGGADNYGVLDLMVRYTLPQRAITRGWPPLEAYVKIANLTNEEYVTFQSSNGRNLGGAGEYPMPPTSVIAGVTLTY